MAEQIRIKDIDLGCVNPDAGCMRQPMPGAAALPHAHESGCSSELSACSVHVQRSDHLGVLQHESKSRNRHGPQLSTGGRRVHVVLTTRHAALVHLLISGSIPHRGWDTSAFSGVKVVATPFTEHRTNDKLSLD